MPGPQKPTHQQYHPPSQQDKKKKSVCKQISSGNSPSHYGANGLFLRVTSTGDQKA